MISPGKYKVTYALSMSRTTREKITEDPWLPKFMVAQEYHTSWNNREKCS